MFCLQDLVKELTSELSKDFAKVILGLMIPSGEYDATCVYNAVRGLGTDEDALIEIFTSRTTAEIQKMKETYRER